MSFKNKCKTGVNALDEVLEGGLYPSSVSLVIGHPGVGKTTFGAQFVYEGLKNGEKGVYVSFVESKADFYRHMRELGLDFEKYEKSGEFIFMEAAPISSIKDLEPSLSLIFETVYKNEAKRLVIDSISAILSILESSRARFILQSTLVRPLKNLGVTMLFIIDFQYGRSTAGFGFEEFVADNVFKMMNKYVKGRIKRVFVISKLRENPLYRVAYEFVIGKGGIKFLLPRETAMMGSISFERLSSGIPELDEMLGGGITKNSITMVCGPSGSGKTMLSIYFAIEGAKNREKICFISFEESSEQIEKIIKSLQIIDEEALKFIEIISISPKLHTSASLYFLLNNLISNEKPNRIILDGLEALKKAFGTLEYLDFLRSIISLLKENNITTYLTNLKDIDFRGDSSLISTLADNIIALWFDKEDSVVKRKLAIFKTRGTAHDMQVADIIIKSSKIEIRKGGS